MSLLLAEGGAGSPVNYTLTCDVGIYVYAGIAAPLQVSHGITCATGTYTYTGQTATLQVGHNLACATGSYVYAGLEATLYVAHGLVCDTGVYAYAGSDATLDFITGVSNYSLLCDTGNYSYIGTDILLEYQSGSVNTQSGVSRLLRSRRPVFPQAPYISIDWSGQSSKPIHPNPVIVQSESATDDSTSPGITDDLKTISPIRQEIKKPVASMIEVEKEIAATEAAILEEEFFLKRRNMALTLLLIAA